MNVLLAHEDADLGAVASAVLGRRNIGVETARCVREAIRKLEGATFDVIAADAGLAEGGGAALVRWLRGVSDTPVIVLADQHDESEMEVMFTAGADDYLPQPFSSKEFALRVQAVARRRRPSSADVIEVGGLTIDRDTWHVSYLERSVRLTRTEQRILYCLAAHAGRVTPLQRLVAFTWRDQGGDTNVLKTHISHLRRKLADAGAAFVIRAVPGVGYAFDLEQRPASSDHRAGISQLTAVS